MDGSDTIARGMIEYSGPAICYSYPVDSMVDSSNTESWRAFIEAAEIDSLSPITLGTTCYFADRDTAITSESGAPIAMVFYASPLAMQLDLESGKLDGCLSYNRYPSVRRSYGAASSPAPYYCAIVPGISEHAQRNSLLTTSLYYRLNEDKYPVVFDGDGVTPVNRLCPASGDLPRHYSYEPGRGRALGRELARSTRNVSISVVDHNLEKAALYFSDILSRERIKASLSDSDGEADCRLIFVPADRSDRGGSLRYLYDVLAADTSAGESFNQTVRIIGKYLELAQSATDSTQIDRFLTMAEQSMAEDIGVFPLFRPRLYFFARDNLKGFSFGVNGELDIRHLVKIVLPSDTKGESR